CWRRSTMVGTADVTGPSSADELATALAEIESLRAENERLRGLLGLTGDVIVERPGQPSAVDRSEHRSTITSSNHIMM
ncbi:MAG TPA: hypothetical protein VIT64_12290, partial [Ilumatobacteraceae bacterium]